MTPRPRHRGLALVLAMVVLMLLGVAALVLTRGLAARAVDLRAAQAAAQQAQNDLADRLTQAR